MSESTLLSFILFQGKNPVTVKTLPNMMLAGLQQLLQMKGLSSEAINRALVHYESGIYAKTDCRSALGSLNDLLEIYRHLIDCQGGLASYDLTGIIMSINDMPQRKLEGCNSWDVTQAKLTVFC
jgi:hypothetical protein